MGRAREGYSQHFLWSNDADGDFGNCLEIGAMTIFYEVIAFIAPAVASGVCAAILFQIIDRLNLFYQNAVEQDADRKAA